MKTNLNLKPSRELTTVSHTNGCGLHHHENCEFLFQVAGTSETIVGDIKTQLSAGDILFINDRVSHVLLKTHKDYRHRDVYISSKRLKEICDLFFDESFFNYLMSTKRIVQLSLDFSLFSSYENRLQKLQTLHSLYPKNTAKYKNSILAIVVSLLGAIYENLQSESDEKPAWLQDFLIRINTPEIFILKIQEIVKLSHYSYTYFSHAFKRYYHQTFKAYIETLKISYAKNLLSNPNTHIVDIALTCGYSSQSHFTQAFKTATGLTPKQYQKKKLSFQK